MVKTQNYSIFFWFASTLNILHPVDMNKNDLVILSDNEHIATQRDN